MKDKKEHSPVKPYPRTFSHIGISVPDVEAAVKFYTDVLGFEKKQDIPVGEFRWLTVVSPEEPGGPELLLEPSDNPAARAYKDSIYEQGIAAAAFAVTDVEGEFERLKQLGVDFKMAPTEMGGTKLALFDDTCGNLIQMFQDS